MSPRFVIGIAGASCSGKTMLAHGLSAAFGPERALVLGLDSYYHDFSGQATHEINVDVPASIDVDCLVGQLGELAAGRAVERPLYDYATHSRAAAGERVQTAELIIVEGLFALYWDAVRAHLNAAVFVTAPDAVCLARRIARDTIERGRTVDSVRAQYEADVRPNFELHVQPTQKNAHLIVNGLDPVDELIGKVLALIPPAGD